MAINSFDEIPGLLFEFNAGIGSTITHSGGTATAIVPNAGTVEDSIPSVGTTVPGYDPGVIKAGEMDALRFPTGTDAKFQIQRGESMGADQDFTILVAFQLDSGGAGDYGCEVETSGGAQIMAYNRTGSDHGFRIGNSGEDSNIVRTTAPTVATCRWTKTGTTVDIWIDGVDTGYAALQSVNTSTWFRICVGGRYDSVTESLGGNLGIFSVYTGVLNNTQIDDINTLARYWLDNGEAPSLIPPTAVTFGPVVTNDDSSVTGWQWEESADGVGWANVGTILADVTGATTTSLTVNSAPIEADQTRVRCKAVSVQEPAGVYSNAAILTVQ